MKIPCRNKETDHHAFPKSRWYRVLGSSYGMHSPVSLSTLLRGSHMVGHWFRPGAALLLCGGIFFGFVAAQDDTKQFKLPKVIEKNATPANIEDLKAMEEHTQQVLKKI